MASSKRWSTCSAGRRRSSSTSCRSKKSTEVVMGKKKVRAVLKIELPAGKATPAPPGGTALGPHGGNIMEFCRAYNERTAQQAGDVVPAEITIFEDRSFTFVLKTPPAGNLPKHRK